MAYLVLARKYRPQTFDEVVEQEHVTRTLTNAIQHGRVAHAILFAGPRGTGKTTIARILAKAMNCRQGPTPQPCNACRSCSEITAGSAADVFEIDGASNNSVDQVRELRENIKYMPAYSSFKIYIIDEVHMLSTPAFNALLKTLEEPPAHILFMFATTEPHKIPVTILSRCQRYDLRRIPFESLKGHMTDLCERENIAIPEESLNVVAREAGGSMRDALSLLDQVMTCSDGPVTHDQVLNILGVVDRRVLSDLADAVLDGEAARVLMAVKTVHERGQDLKKLYADLLTHMRNLIVIKVGDPSMPLVDLPESEIQLLRSQVERRSASVLNQVFTMLFREEALVRLSTRPRLAIEMVLMQTCQIKPAIPVDELIHHVEALRQAISHGGQGGSDFDAPLSEPQTPRYGEADPDGCDDALKGSKAKQSQTMPIPTIAEERSKVWVRTLALLGQRLPALAANLQQSSLVSADEGIFEIQVQGNEFSINRVQRRESIQAIRRAVKDLFGWSPKIAIHGISKDPAAKREKKIHEDQLKQQALSHPMVSEVVELFQGKIMDVKVLPPSEKKESR
jgi:DNA polymerase-3 subunit gamma/tau